VSAVSGLDPHAATRYLYALGLGDTALVAGHRLSEWCGRAPTLEEELALANMGLDWLGQARLLLEHAAASEGRGRSGDDLAFRRDSAEFRNLLLAEQPNGDFAHSIARQWFLSTFAASLWHRLMASADATISAIAGKAHLELRYHVRHTAEWVVRLGDGTDESHARMQSAVEALWMYTGELFASNDTDRAAAACGIGVAPDTVHGEWDAAVDGVLSRAGLARPRDGWMATGGKDGRHTEHLGHLLAHMQVLPRSDPGATW
jgi:ring-1,2-phenylacetyl-CoA epoxidase subunit PaaC